MLSLMAGGLLAGCRSRASSPEASPSSAPGTTAVPQTSGAAAGTAASAPRQAVASDYAWFQQVTDLSKGFCFVWVRDLRSSEVIERMGGEELERIVWQQMVGAGDGQRGATDKYYFGVTRLDDDWALVIEDNGTLGRADDLLRPLSAGTTVVCHYRAANGSGRFLLLEDSVVQVDFDPATPARRTGTRAGELGRLVQAVGFDGPAGSARRTAAAFALAERLTGVPLDLEGLQNRTYAFSAAPTGQ